MTLQEARELLEKLNATWDEWERRPPADKLKVHRLRVRIGHWERRVRMMEREARATGVQHSLSL